MSEQKEIFIILSKYIKHVGNCEGVDFISDRELKDSPCDFTDYEINFLKTVSQQVENEYKPK